jgi:hypothetical protein
MLDLRTGSLILLLRNCAYKIISRIESLLAPPPLVNLHSLVQRNLPLLPICSDNPLNRNPPTPPSVHSVIRVRILQLQGALLAGWVKLQPKQPGALVLSTNLPSRPSNRLLATSDPSISLNSLRIQAYLGAVMHLHLKINHWAGLVRVVLGDLEAVPTPVLLAFLRRTVPRNNRPPLLACSDKIKQPAVHLVRRGPALNVRWHELTHSRCE